MHKFKVFLLPVLLLSCQASVTPLNSSETLATIAGEAVPSEEFLYIYKKNNFNSDTLDRREDIAHYLELFINFKLKVKEAEALGLHKTDVFKEELEGYRKLLAKPYLTENSVTENLIEEAYERLKTEVNASHILVAFPPEAVPADTLQSYNRIKEIRERAMNGEDFAELAKLYSDDPSAKMNGGNLGYFTALQMVYPFEDAAYNTAEGAISRPVRTQFGYHIIKVHDKRPSQGKVKVSHIMIRATDGLLKQDSIAAREKAYEVYEQLAQGADWDEMVRQFSDDLSTKSSGGALPWFGTGNMIPAIEEAAFALDTTGDIAKPVKSPYGWHIIRLDEKRGLEPFEVMAPSIKIKVSKDSRSELNKAALVKRLKVENEFVEYQEVMDRAVEAADASLSLGTWSYDTTETGLEQTVFELKGKQYTLGDFYAYVAAHQKPREDISPEWYMAVLLDDFAVKSILAYEEAHLADKYDEYRMLLKEYRDGILLFELMDKMVWSKAIADTAGLHDFFNTHSGDYRWGKRARATLYSVSDEQVLAELKDRLQKGGVPASQDRLKVEGNTPDGNWKSLVDSLVLQTDEKGTYQVNIYSGEENRQAADMVAGYLMDKGVAARVLSAPSAGPWIELEVVTDAKDALEEFFNKNQPLTLQIEEGCFEEGDKAVLNKIKWTPGAYTIQYDGRVYYVIIEEILEEAPKKLSETRGMVISDYQAYLEKEWVAALREKYPVKVNQKALDKIYSTLEDED